MLGECVLTFLEGTGDGWTWTLAEKGTSPAPQATNNVPSIFLLKCPAVARNTV